MGKGSQVGLSLYGAGAMAQSGSSYEDILKYYYTGITVSKEK
jgi:stage II sporulation protein D